MSFVNLNKVHILNFCSTRSTYLNIFFKQMFLSVVHVNTLHIMHFIIHFAFFSGDLIIKEVIKIFHHIS